MVPLAQAQPAKIQTAFGQDAGTLSDKFTRSRARYGGQVRLEARPGVRSVADVFNLIVTENGSLPARSRRTECGRIARALSTESGIGENAGSSEGFLRQSAKNDTGLSTTTCRHGETVRKT